MPPHDGYGPGPYVPSAEELATTGNTTLSNAVSADGTPEVGRLYTIPARQGLAVRMKAGQRVKVLNPHGTQVVDSWAFNAADTGEYMSMEHMRTAIGRIIPRPGDGLATNKRRPILTMLEDTTPGIHDTIISACDIWRYRGLGVEGYHDSCTDNLCLAFRAIGLPAPEIPSPFNLFMNIPVHADGSVTFEPPTSRPGDHVTFRAEMDLIYAVSTCPQDIIPINGVGCTPVDAQLQVLDRSDD